INPDECVALGAAVQGGVLGGDVKDMVLVDVTPLSLGIETLGGVFNRIIDRNTTIPVKKSQVYSTAANGQTSVEIHVLQGEREMASGNTTLGRFTLDGIPPAPRGVPQIEVTFDIDANGIVNVTAQDKGTGKEQHITITSSSNMSKEDIDRAVKEAEKFAESDKKQKEAAETKNKADSLIYQSEKTLEEMGDKVSEADKAPVREAIDKLKKSMENGTSEEIKADSDALEKAFYAISEKLYQQQQAAGGQGAGFDPNAGAGFNANAGAGANGGGDDTVYNADFEDKTGDNK
ncbi:MAG: Hsp70 family protein, partial [Clostridia bacterium]|nr:Hsp70 family protein [Clostridia bacterium]